MSESQQMGQPAPKKSGFIGKILGTLIASLIISIIVEWICMSLFWKELGANHSKQMMFAEFNWFSQEFQQSLIYSHPVAIAEQVIHFLHQWMFIKTGLQNWLATPKDSDWGQLLFYYTHQYVESMFYITIVFVIRLMIIVLTSPIFILAALVGLIDGLVERDLRRFGVGRESAFKYHHSKKMVGPIMFSAWILYLAIPVSIHPNLILIPAAVLFGIMIRLTATNFKKHL